MVPPDFNPNSKPSKNCFHESSIDFGEADGKAKIYRIAPGTAVPIHTHTGAEVTLVLSGGFTDETGGYGPGDIAIQEAGGEHQPVADDDGECVVVVVVPLSHRLRLRFWVDG